ncbi:MAG: polymer-forming cytoskeletal protein [Proteobacteria bacterium]|nr:polymer-forming cytoskeletal protein [Pseudomonadota bacterium]
MFNSRKVTPPAFDNAYQASSFEEEAEVSMVVRPNNSQIPSSSLPHSATPRNLDLATKSMHDPDVLAQTEMARQYANEVAASKQNNPAVVPDPDAARLCIGSAIKMKGSVEDCGVLQVDGHFEASAQSNQLKVSESGIFIGDADVHSAEIVGRFDGNITVKDKLIIRSTGVVTGTVKYGSIEIESGGRISGDIQATLRNEPVNEQPREQPREQPSFTGSPGATAAPAAFQSAPERSPLRLNLSYNQPDSTDRVSSASTAVPSNGPGPTQAIG